MDFAFNSKFGSAILKERAANEGLRILRILRFRFIRKVACHLLNESRIFLFSLSDQKRVHSWRSYRATVRVNYSSLFVPRLQDPFCISVFCIILCGAEFDRKKGRRKGELGYFQNTRIHLIISSPHGSVISFVIIVGDGSSCSTWTYTFLSRKFNRSQRPSKVKLKEEKSKNSLPLQGAYIHSYGTSSILAS